MAHTADLTIDELAARAGMTVRNVRAHQSRGLLPPPEVRGRTGFYGAEHLARLELVKELQADGFNLEGIRRLIDSAGGSTAQVLRFTREVRSSFEEEEPDIVDAATLTAQYGDEGDPKLLQRAIALGLMRPLGDGQYEQRSPRLGAAAEELIRLGIPPRRVIGLAEVMRRHADGVADAYVKLFLDEVWKPFDEAGRPEDRWPEVNAAFEAVGPLATEALMALFGIVMSDRVEEAIEQVLHRAAKSPGDSRSRSRSRSRGDRR